MDMQEMIRRAMAERDGQNVKSDDRLPEAISSDLKEKFALFTKKHDFKPGDLVQWKPGMKNKNGDGPYIVVAVLSEAVMDSGKESGSPYFREPLDITLAEIHSDGDFLIYHYDSRRFEPYTGPVA